MKATSRVRARIGAMLASINAHSIQNMLRKKAGKKQLPALVMTATAGRNHGPAMSRPNHGFKKHQRVERKRSAYLAHKAVHC